MRWKTLPVNGLNSALLMLMLLGCGSLSARAQEESEPQAETDSSTPAAITTTPAEQPAPDKTSENSPSDYQASEEISQDLSVSFPVDI